MISKKGDVHKIEKIHTSNEDKLPEETGVSKSHIKEGDKKCNEQKTTK